MTRTPEATVMWYSCILVLPLLAALVLGAPESASAQDASGTWETHIHAGDDHPERVDLSLRLDREGDRGNWQMGLSVEAADLIGISDTQLRGSTADVRFEIRREAGTFAFDGDIRDGRGTGFYTFTADSAYVARMAELGYPNLSSERLFGFATQDVTTAYVGELQTLGYRDLAERDLWKFAIHHVTSAYIRGMNDLGYRDIDPDDLVKLRIHGVSLDYVGRVRAALGGG